MPHQLPAALRCLGMGSRSETDTAVAQLTHGRSLHRAGHPAEALAYYQRAMAADARLADAPHLAALAHLAMGEPIPASTLLEQAARLAPADPGVRHNLGRVRLLLGQTEAALLAFEDALRLNPGHLQAGMARAGMLESLGRPAQAAEGFLAVARHHPAHVPALVGAARQLYRVDRMEQAMQCQREAATLDPTVWSEGRIGFARAGGAPVDCKLRSAESAALCVVADGVDGVAAAQARELVVVDDFLPDPWKARREALTLPFLHGDDEAAVNYPGRQTDGGWADATLLQRIVDLIGRDLKWGWPGHGAFRLSPARSVARSDIHADHDDARPAYAGVLYLTQPPYCRGGTGFWRHRETGWERVPTDADAAGTRWRSASGFLAQQRRDEAGAFASWSDARRDWAPVIEVPMRFNRLAVYRSDYFHAISEVFGDNAEEARLVQLFFFEPLGS